MNASKKEHSCFNARIGAMIYGIIMSVISGIAVVVCIGLFIYTNLVTSLGYRLDLQHNYDRYLHLDDFINVVIMNAAISFALILSLLDFSFSVVLAVGASKEKTGHLRAYFIYGVCRIVMLVIFNTVLYIVQLDIIVGSLVLLVTGIYSLMLTMVYKVRQQIKCDPKGYHTFNN